jgi:hypothetical protein
MSAVTSPTNQTEIFARSLDRRREWISPEVARFFQELELSTDDNARLEELAEKARQGTLTAQDEQDLEEYRRVGRLVELMRLKGRLASRVD